jgi:hypothetical protein
VVWVWDDWSADFWKWRGLDGVEISRLRVMSCLCMFAKGAIM